MGSLLRRITVLALAGALAGSFGACAATNPGSKPEQPKASVSAKPAPGPMSVKVTAASGNETALPSDWLAISAKNGDVAEVSVTTEDGREVLGQYSDGKWKAIRGLFPDTKFTVKVTTKNVLSETQEFTSTFKTIKPRIDATYEFKFKDKEFGVGMPVVIWFASDVTTAEQKAAVENAITVTSTPAQVGAWGWTNDRQLVWRPKDYWQPGTKVKVDARIAGLQTGPEKWIGVDGTASFSIGPNRHAKVDMSNYKMDVYDGKKLIRTIPITNGIAKYPTRFGKKVILDKVRIERMRPEGTDVKGEDYDLMVHWALRTTWTGEYLHAAPWSASAHGRYNASHGCTGMSNSNAEWYFDFSQIGDVVEYVGSDQRVFKQGEGLAVWNLTWAEWQKLSANHKK